MLQTGSHGHRTGSSGAWRKRFGPAGQVDSPLWRRQISTRRSNVSRRARKARGSSRVRGPDRPARMFPPAAPGAVVRVAIRRLPWTYTSPGRTRHLRSQACRLVGFSTVAVSALHAAVKSAGRCGSPTKIVQRSSGLRSLRASLSRWARRPLLELSATCRHIDIMMRTTSAHFPSKGDLSLVVPMIKQARRGGDRRHPGLSPRTVAA